MSEATSAAIPRLTEAQQQIRLRLMQGETLERIAAITGLTPDEVCHAIADPLFTASINTAREARWQQLVCRVQILATQAVEVLAGAIQDKDATIRTRAARLLLDYQLKLQRLQATAASKAAQKLRQEAEMVVRQTTNPASRNGVIPMPGVR